MNMVVNIIFFILNYTIYDGKNPNKFLYISVLIFKAKLYVGYLLPWYIRYHKCR